MPEPLSAGMGMLYGGLAGGGLSALGSIFGGGDAPELWGPKIMRLPKYSFTEPRLRMMSDWVTDAFGNLAEGEPPWYWKKAAPRIRGGMMRGLQSQYYGMPGQTGSMEAAREAGAAMGLGPKAQIAQVDKQLAKYNQQAQAIDEYMAQLDVSQMNQMAQLASQVGLGIPAGPPAVVATPGGTSQPTYAGGGVGGALSGLGGNIGEALMYKAMMGDDAMGAYNPVDLSLSPAWSSFSGLTGGGGNLGWNPSMPSMMPSYWQQSVGMPLSSSISPGMNYAGGMFDLGGLSNWGF